MGEDSSEYEKPEAVPGILQTRSFPAQSQVPCVALGHGLHRFEILLESRSQRP